MKKNIFKSTGGKDQKKKVLGILAVLTLILSLAGTFAWKSYTDWVKNHMQSLGFDSGDVSIVEDFNPNDPIGPGGTIKKKVDVINSTPVEAFVRISLEEELASLQAGATAASPYKTEAEAGFPVIIDAKAYYLAGNGYTDQTSKLTLNGVKVDPATTGLRLFTKGEDKVLLNEITISDTDFPANFEFKKAKLQIPIRPAAGDTEAQLEAKQALAMDALDAKTGQTVNAAQKVVGYVERDVATDTYKAVTTNADDAKNIFYWGYGKTVGALAQADWAGANAWVATPADITNEPTFNTGSINSKLNADLKINFTTGNILKGAASTFDFSTADKSKWFYNTEDGYFYLLSPLKSGTQTSASVIESIQYPASEAFNLAAYDLHVGSEAIPAQRSMLLATSLKGEVTAAADKATYKATGKVTVSNDSGFGLEEASPLYKFLANQATIEESE